MIGWLVIFFTFYPQPGYTALSVDNTPPSTSGFVLARAVGIVLGIYIIVRGLDNITQSQWPRWMPRYWRGRWDRMFRR